MTPDLLAITCLGFSTSILFLAMAYRIFRGDV